MRLRRDNTATTFALFAREPHAVAETPHTSPDAESSWATRMPLLGVDPLADEPSKSSERSPLSAYARTLNGGPGVDRQLQPRDEA